MPPYNEVKGNRNVLPKGVWRLVYGRVEVGGDRHLEAWGRSGPEAWKS